MRDQKRRRSRPLRPLPDEVVMEILSRLPAYDALKFRRVCRKWRDLISSQYFEEMHMKNKVYCSPKILVQEKLTYGYGKVNDIHLLDKLEPPRKRPIIRKVPLNFIPSSGCGLAIQSYNGLLLLDVVCPLQKPHDFFIVNPISGGQVRIRRQNPEFGFYGMFFNRWVGEYCILWGLFEHGPKVQFKLLNLGSQPCCRDLKLNSSFRHQPRCPFHEPTVVIDDATLYWLAEKTCCPRTNLFLKYCPCEELIIAFDIKTAEFRLMPHPGPTDDCNVWQHSNVNILEMDGHLSFVRCTVTETLFILNIWTLRDALWIQSHSVSINVNQLNIRFDRLRNGGFRAMALGNGELLLQHSYNQRIYAVYACSLELGTFRKIGRAYKEANMSIYVPSLVSLRKCKPQIWV